MDWMQLVAVKAGDDFDAAAKGMGWADGADMLKSMDITFDEVDPENNFVMLQDEDGTTVGSEPQSGAKLELIGPVAVWFTMGSEHEGNRWYPTEHIAFKDDVGDIWYQGDGSF